MTPTKTKKLNNYLKDVVNTISPDELLMYNKDTKEIVVAGKPLPPQVSAQIRAEIKMLKEGMFWKFLAKDVIFTSNLILAEKGETADDIIFNRAVKHTIKTVTEIINNWNTIVEQSKKPEEKTEQK